MKNINLKVKYFFFFIIIILSTISIIHSINQANLYSFDFHLSPAKLVSEGINHYQYVLEGKHDGSPEDRLLYSQDGLYGHGLFIILIPFTWLSWDDAKMLWALINVFFSFLIIFLLFKRFRLPKELILLSICLFFMSTPFRINISYGQQTLFTFLFFLFPFLFNNKISLILSGFSYFKYNLGYVIFLYFVSLKKISKIILSLIPCIIGWLCYSYITNSNLLVNLVEPILILDYFLSKENHLPVTIFSLLTKIGLPRIIGISLPIVLSFYVIFNLIKVKDELFKISIICLTCLSFASHQLHDYILLFPLLMFSLKNFNLLISKINLLLIFYFFFFLRILSFFYGFQPWDFPYGNFGYLNNFLTIFVLLINMKFYMQIKIMKNDLKKI
ncbi:glycosyltransferase 87 family protein [Candidatus Pelagibacter sp.]|nr:glycosyltransferase 87 family protein [Candidatus Pelagibacter sp.]